MAFPRWIVRMRWRWCIARRLQFKIHFRQTQSNENDFIRWTYLWRLLHLRRRYIEIHLWCRRRLQEFHHDEWGRFSTLFYVNMRACVRSLRSIVRCKNNLVSGFVTQNKKSSGIECDACECDCRAYTHTRLSTLCSRCCVRPKFHTIWFVVPFFACGNRISTTNAARTPVQLHQFTIEMRIGEIPVIIVGTSNQSSSTRISIMYLLLSLSISVFCVCDICICSIYFCTEWSHSELSKYERIFDVRMIREKKNIQIVRLPSVGFPHSWLYSRTWLSDVECSPRNECSNIRRPQPCAGRISTIF